jgi:hypothetical protein
VSIAFLAAALSLCAQDLPAVQAKTLAAGLIETTTLPANFAAFGVGVKSGSNLNGASAICHAITAVNYLCAESKFSGSTTANTIELKQVVLARRGFVAAINGNAGLATGADGATGGAFAAGGALLYNISRLPPLRSQPGLYLGFSAAWDKRNVTEFIDGVRSGPGLRASLQPFATRGTYYFFVGKGW